MHAIVADALGGPEVLNYRELPDPKPGPGQLLIGTRLTGVNFADIMARQGRYHGGAEPPFVPGLDCVGTVEALGDGVEAFAVGDRVAAFPAGGSYATQAVADARLTYSLPGGLADETGAGLTVLVTAYNVLTLAGRLAPGETVLVHAAAGGVGHTAIQLARALGAGLVIGVVGSVEKAAVARAAGADHTVVRHEEDFVSRVLDLTDGGADLILDSVAGETLVRGLACLAPFGRLVVYGQASGEPAQIPSSALHKENRAVIGYSSGNYRRHRAERLRPAVEAAFGHALDGQIRLLVGARYALQDAREAHVLLESGRSIGKILLAP